MLYFGVLTIVWFRNLVWHSGGYRHLVCHHQRLCHRRHLRLHPSSRLCLQVRTVCRSGSSRGGVRVILPHKSSSFLFVPCCMVYDVSFNICVKCYFFSFPQVYDGLCKCQSVCLPSCWLWEEIPAKNQWFWTVWRSCEVLQVKFKGLCYPGCAQNTRKKGEASKHVFTYVL